MTPNAIYSKSGKGVQEASGKTSILSRGDRAVLSAFDGRVTVGGVAEKVGKPFDAKFEQLVTQLEKDGFIREVSSGAPVASASAPVRPAAARPAARPAATGGGEELDFTIASPAPKAAPGVDLAAKARAEAERKAKEEEAHSYKARQEAEARAKAEAEARAKAANQARLQAEAAAKAKAESEARARAEAEAKAKAAEADKVRAEAEAKVKAAQQAALRLASEAKAKAEAEMQHKLEAERAKAREETERIRKETEEKARKEAEELRQRLEAERKAREEAERKAKEAEERRRKDDEERRAREETERKAREAAERKAKEEAERKAKEEAERKAKEQAERRAKEERDENERRAKEEAERRARDEKERGEREAREARERAQEEEAAAKRRAESEKPHEEKAGKPADSFADSLLADLDSFDKRDEEEQKTKAEAERKAKEEKARRRKQEEERRAREEAELEAKEEAERKAKAEAKRREKERVEREEREAQERAEREAEERKRKARESLSAKAQDAAADKAGAGADDIGISDEDLDLDDVKRDEQALSKESRRAARERERQRERDKEREPDGRGDQEQPAARVEAAAAPAKFRRPVKWGKPLALGLFGLLAAAIAVLHIMPISTGEYESAASEALGVPVKIGSANLSLVTGVQVKMENVTVGAAKIARLRAYPEVGSLFGPRKAFSRIEIDGATLPQQSIGAALYGKVKAANFEVGRISAQKVKLDGPLALPLLDADLQLGAGGELRTLTLRGPDSLLARVVPAGSDLEFELNAATFTVPMASEISFSQFGMKGTANREGMDIAAWTASLYDGVLNGNAKIDWRDRWTVDGVVTARGVNAAVFAPALLSEGKAEGTGKFSMSGADPGKVASAARMEGTFTINKGVLGSIDISRALSTGGRQGSGRTPFSELAGQGLYDKGNVSFRNVTISAGALNAGASADIAAGGALSGRIVADVRTPSQTLRATLAIGGTVKEPQVRN